MRCRLEARVALCKGANVGKAGIATDRPRLFPDNLQAVVVFRIMAGRYHDAAVGTERTGCEVHHLGTAKTDVQHIATGSGYPRNNRIAELGTGLANIAANDDPPGAQIFNQRIADAVCDLCVQLVRNSATNVVRLEAGDFHRIALL